MKMLFLYERGRTMYQLVVAAVFLSLCTYTDLKNKYIYRKLAVIMAAFAAAGHLIKGDLAVSDCVLSILPGMFCFLVSLLTREALGYGDSLVITICGFSLGLEKVVDLLMTGLFFAALWAIGLCIFRKVDRKHEIPFMPFLTLGFMVQVMGLI